MTATEMKLPAEFVARTKALLGDEWDAFEAALNAESPTSIRLNPFKNGDAVRQTLPLGERVPWASNAFYLAERPVFTLDPLFHAGCYYVQEASSMSLEDVLRRQVTEPVRVLDLCAAPGGKSTQLSAVLPVGSLLVANEVIRSRANILSENLTKWGNPHTIVTNNAPAEIGRLGAFFDVVVVDAPCSGEGMFRKDPASIGEWSVANVQQCAERQRRIVADVWAALRTGGLLIYSTCTYNREENEDNIDHICRELGASVVEEPRRFMPHRTKGEGFFIAAMRKEGLAGERLQGNDKKLKERLKIVSSGVPPGAMKGKDFIPSHSLAMSCDLLPDAFPRWELDKTTALHFLKAEALQNVPENLPRGYVLATYLDCPLGFVKNIGTRANNLYPKEWRIRMPLPV
ncbi:rRNA cytosine-C5-methyltransferase [Bacteroidia bacterium]|nr:rRNA cytosine-C5-methyltransferase [Bacteroidia bacterium]